MTSVWTNVRKETLRVFRDVFSSEIKLKETLSGKTSMQQFKQSFPEQTTFYQVGTFLESFLVLIYLTPHTANTITELKLSGNKPDLGEEESEEEAGGREITPQLLDLYLMSPMAEDLMKALRTAFEAAAPGEMSTEFVLRDSFLTLDDMQIDEDDLDLFRFSLTFSREGRDEELSIGFCFLYAPLEKLSVQSGRVATTANLDVTDPWVSHMHSSVLHATVPLSMVLEKCQMSVAECSRFEIGDVINLPGSSLTELSVMAETRGSKINLARAALGIMKQNKAVKLLEDLETDFIMDLPTMMADGAEEANQT